MDHRDIAALSDKWWNYIDENSMTITVEGEFEDDEGRFVDEIRLPFTYVVCRTCDGRGTYVNPSIDSHGITASEFAEDPDFATDYFSGTYNITCANCSGKRVEPEIDESMIHSAEDKTALRLLRQYQQEKIDDARMILAERMFGC